MRRRAANTEGFSLIEVALAMGVIVFGLVGVLGMVPTGLDASRRAIDATRAAMVAQRLIAEFQGQAFTGVKFSLYDTNGNFVRNAATVFDLSALTSASGPAEFTANNNGEVMYFDTGETLFADPPSPPVDRGTRYYIAVRFDNAPAGYDAGNPTIKYASKLAIRVSWDQRAGANVTMAQPSSYADFVGVVSRY